MVLKRTFVVSAVTAALAACAALAVQPADAATTTTTTTRTTTTTTAPPVAARTDGTPVKVVADGSTTPKRVTFTATAGLRVSVGCTQSGSGTVQFTLQAPDGSAIGGAGFCGVGTVYDAVATPVTGTYTLNVDVRYAPAGTVSVSV